MQSPVSNYGRRKLIEAGANELEANVVGYLPHTMTVEPFEEWDIEYYHLDSLQKGFYYLVSPKVGLNKTSNQINSSTTWTFDSDALSKCDFGINNTRMATFMQIFLDECKRFVLNNGRRGVMRLRFGRFFEDDRPMMLIGPMSIHNKDSVAFALQVLPHEWIHGLCWRGPSKRASVEDGKCDGADTTVALDFYSVVMDDHESDIEDNVAFVNL